MKKIFVLAFTAAFAFTSCSNNEGSNPTGFVVKDAPQNVSFEAGEEAVIEVFGNVAWTAEVTSGTGGSLAEGSESGRGNGEVTVVFTENSSAQERVIEVTVATTAKVDTPSFIVTITQAGRVVEPEPVFTVDESPLDVPYTANEDAVIAVTGNVAWSAAITAGAGATLATGSENGEGDGQVTVVFTENEVETTRTVTVTVSTTAEVAQNSYNVIVTQTANPGEQSPADAYVRVDATIEDWTGEYLIVYEAQAKGANANNFGATTILAYDGTGNPPLNAGGNVYQLSSTKPGSPAELATLTGGKVSASATEVTVTGGQIGATEEIDKYRITIAKVQGGYSLLSTSGYYIGSGAKAGELVSSTEFSAAALEYVHNITIGDTNSNVANNTGITYKNCAIICSGSTVSVFNTLRVNGGTGRFGYWGSEGDPIVMGQHPIALYKRNAPVEE